MDATQLSCSYYGYHFILIFCTAMMVGNELICQVFSQVYDNIEFIDTLPDC